MKIAIIGAGFFGATAALKLSKYHDVDLFEKKKDILNGASKINQFRFHLGFHYPRSKKTLNEIKRVLKVKGFFLMAQSNMYSFNNLMNFRRFLKALIWFFQKKKPKSFYLKLDFFNKFY